jgi:hypothetical protein
MNAEELSTPNFIAVAPKTGSRSRAFLILKNRTVFSFCQALGDIVMIQSGCPLDDHTVPDASVGMAWGGHWTSNKFDDVHGARLKHPHFYPDWFPQSAVNPVEAWIYPVKALGDFRIWLYRNYIPVNFPKYLDRKVRTGIFLPSRAELLLEAVSKKGLASPPVAALPTS